MAESIMINVVSVDQMGAEIRCMEEFKPKGCPGLGGWKSNERGVWWTRVKGADAKKFAAFIGQYPDLVLDGDKIVSVS